MRIAVDAASCFNRRGFGRFSRELLGALVARASRHDYVLLVDREPAADELPAPLAALPRIDARPARKVTESAVAGSRRTLSELFAFTRAARRARADLVFLPAVQTAFPLWPGTRSVICFHDTIAESLPRLTFPDRAGARAWRWKSRLAAHQATRVMTVSAASRDALVARYRLDPDRIDVVSEGAAACFRPIRDPAAIAAARARHGLPERGPLLLFVGGLSPHKNLPLLLEAFARAAAAAPAGDRPLLVIAGDPAGDGFHSHGAAIAAQVARDERLSARVLLLGFVDDDGLALLMNAAHALVLPSKLEGFGLPALESLQCGTPVIASATGALREIVGEAGTIVPVDDLDALAAALRDALTDPGWRTARAAHAAAQAARFSWAGAAELADASFARAARGSRG